jgi:hypothetical protein
MRRMSKMVRIKTEGSFVGNFRFWGRFGYHLKMATFARLKIRGARQDEEKMAEHISG